MIQALLDRVRKGPRYRYRRADTGEFCSWLYAKMHPATTVRERIR